MSIKLIVGLRNPGANYEYTRHNAGGWFVLSLAKQNACHFTIEKKMQAELCELELNNHRCKLALPLTFMNHSGQTVRAISQFYQFHPEEILIIHDDLDLSPGRIKLKTDGGHGGHNGLRDITSHLGTPRFHRLRIGIGHPGHRDLVHDYVLHKPSVHDKQLIHEAIDRAIAEIPVLLSGDIAKAMNQINS